MLNSISQWLLIDQDMIANRMQCTISNFSDSFIHKDAHNESIFDAITYCVLKNCVSIVFKTILDYLIIQIIQLFNLFQLFI